MRQAGAGGLWCEGLGGSLCCRGEDSLERESGSRACEEGTALSRGGRMVPGLDGGKGAAVVRCRSVLELQVQDVPRGWL